MLGGDLGALSDLQGSGTAGGDGGVAGGRFPHGGALLAGDGLGGLGVGVGLVGVGHGLGSQKGSVLDGSGALVRRFRGRVLTIAYPPAICKVKRDWEALSLPMELLAPLASL